MAKTKMQQRGNQWSRYNERLNTVVEWLRESGADMGVKDFDISPFVERVLRTWDYHGHTNRAEPLVKKALAVARGERVIRINGGRTRIYRRAAVDDLARIVKYARAVDADMGARELAYNHVSPALKALIACIDVMAAENQIEPAE